MRRDRVRPRVQPVECTGESREQRHLLEAYDSGLRVGRLEERRRWREQIGEIVDLFDLRDRYRDDDDGEPRGWIP